MSEIERVLQSVLMQGTTVESHRRPAKLGTRQGEMLAWLRSHRCWHPVTSGVVVGRYISDTMRVIDSLRRRGLVEFADGGFRMVQP